MKFTIILIKFISNKIKSFLQLSAKIHASSDINIMLNIDIEGLINFHPLVCNVHVLPPQEHNVQIMHF